MATHGRIGEFNRAEEEDWTAYCERLEQYFLANDVESAEKQRAILLSVCGAATYQLVRNLVAPDKPTDKSFDEIVKLVKEHHTPPPSEIVQRFKFNSRSQRDGESVAEFMAELRRLSEHCKFEATLDNMLRDRLVCGIRDVRTQRRLLAEADLTRKKAFELAQAAEVAEKQAKDLRAPITGTVHTLQKQPSTPVLENCSRCGGKHAAASCRFKDAECYLCHKKGHLARVCRSKAGQSTRERRRSRTDRASSDTHTLQMGEEGGADAAYALFHVREEDSEIEPIKATVLVNGASLEMEVDTGTARSIISAATYKELGTRDQAPPLHPMQKCLYTYTRESIEVMGTFTATVQYEDLTAERQLVVVVGTGPSLMGRDWLQSIQFDWEILHHTGTANPQANLGMIPNTAKDAFGLEEEPSARIQKELSTQPSFKSQTVPCARKGRVEQGLERLERSGIYRNGVIRRHTQSTTRVPPPPLDEVTGRR